MNVVGVPRDDVPMNMRRHVAQTGDVDFFRPHDFPHSRLDRPHCAHDAGAVGRIQIGHFLDMRIPDDAAEAGIGTVIDQHDAQRGIAEHHQPTTCVAQLAGMCHALHQNAFDTAAVGARYILRQPVFSQQMSGHFNNDVVGRRVGIFVVA